MYFQLVLHWGFSLGVNWGNCTRSSVLIVQNRCGTVCQLLNTCLVCLQKLLLVTCWYWNGRWKMELWFQEYPSYFSKEKLLVFLSPKHFLIVDWEDFFAGAKFWLIKVCVSELGWSRVKLTPKELCRVGHMLFISWESQSVLHGFVVADSQNLSFTSRSAFGWVQHFLSCSVFSV